MHPICKALLVVFAPGVAAAAPVLDSPGIENTLPNCGDQYAPPFGDPRDAGARPCPPAAVRSYRPKHHGIGFYALNLESEACFVPDSTFRLLDQIIDEVQLRASREGLTATDFKKEAGVRRLAALTGEVMADLGFGLHIPTETLGDALFDRQKLGEPARRLFDCDTGSLILLAVAESLNVPAALVEITLPSGSGHNYVRFPTGSASSLDWDVNGRGACRTPANLPVFEGVGMTVPEAQAYLWTLSASAWEARGDYRRAVADNSEASRLDPSRPKAFNNAAWVVATREFSGRAHLKAYALAAAERAVGLHRVPNYLDTLACAQALNGDFKSAARTQEQVVSGAPNNAAFARRLALFRQTPARDCTGE